MSASVAEVLFSFELSAEVAVSDFVSSEVSVLAFVVVASVLLDVTVVVSAVSLVVVAAEVVVAFCVSDDLWERQGYLLTTEGNVVHYGFIENFIDELGTRFNIREIAFDRWGAVQMSQNLEGLGFTLVQFGQGYRDMSPPTKELMKLTLEQKIAHNGHPVLRWNMDNIFIKRDPAGNIKPDKEKSTEKIDGTVATIMALDRAIRCGNDSGDSIYDERDLLVL